MQGRRAGAGAGIEAGTGTGRSAGVGSAGSGWRGKFGLRPTTMRPISLSPRGGIRPRKPGVSAVTFVFVLQKVNHFIVDAGSKAKGMEVSKGERNKMQE